MVREYNDPDQTAEDERLAELIEEEARRRQAEYEQRDLPFQPREISEAPPEESPLPPVEPAEELWRPDSHRMREEEAAAAPAEEPARNVSPPPYPDPPDEPVPEAIRFPRFHTSSPQSVDNYPAAASGPEQVSSGTVEDRIAMLEAQNRALMEQVEQMPALLQQALQQMQAAMGQVGGGGGGVDRSLPVPTEEEEGAPAAPANPLAAMMAGPGGGGGGALGSILKLAQLGQQLGFIGGGQSQQSQGSGAQAFMGQMQQYLSIQNAMEALQMQKFNNTTVWLARMAKLFGKEGFANIAKAEIDKDAAAAAGAPQVPPQMEAFVMPGQGGAQEGDDE
jgi:hypothetical protein